MVYTVKNIVFHHLRNISHSLVMEYSMNPNKHQKSSLQIFFLKNLHFYDRKGQVTFYWTVDMSNIVKLNMIRHDNHFPVSFKVIMCIILWLLIKCIGHARNDISCKFIETSFSSSDREFENETSFVLQIMQQIPLQLSSLVILRIEVPFQKDLVIKELQITIYHEY